ncbi:MAG: hypothetical protein AB2693_31940 [Candidatus Thiodiazotropha sp.]
MTTGIVKPPSNFIADRPKAALLFKLFLVVYVLLVPMIVTDIFLVPFRQAQFIGQPLMLSLVVTNFVLPLPIWCLGKDLGLS